MLDLIMMESLRQSSVPSATIILFFRALSARTSRILVMYQACYVTYCLKNFLHKFGASKSITEQNLLLLANQQQIHGGNFKMVGHVTNLMPCKVSSAAL